MTAGYVQLAAAFAAGAAAGGIHLSGLWWTVRRLAQSRQKGILLASSFAVRTAGAALVLYLVSGAEWPRLLAGISGFVLTRAVVLHRMRASSAGAAAAVRGEADGS
jgi:F1F0 ATPase subunit 2